MTHYGIWFWMWHHAGYYTVHWHWVWLTPIILAVLAGQGILSDRREQASKHRGRMFPGGCPHAARCHRKGSHEHPELKKA